MNKTLGYPREKIKKIKAFHPLFYDLSSWLEEPATASVPQGEESRRALLLPADSALSIVIAFAKAMEPANTALVTGKQCIH